MLFFIFINYFHKFKTNYYLLQKKVNFGLKISSLAHSFIIIIDFLYLKSTYIFIFKIFKHNILKGNIILTMPSKLYTQIVITFLVHLFGNFIYFFYKIFTNFLFKIILN